MKHISIISMSTAIFFFIVASITTILAANDRLEAIAAIAYGWGLACGMIWFIICLNSDD